MGCVLANEAMEPGMVAAMGPRPVAPGQPRQRCFKCEGKGFCHDSSMDHDKGPDERCFFCKPCTGCGGSGAVAGSNQQVAYGPGGGFGPMVVTTGGGKQRCFKCEGKGFCHDSSMTHDKGPDERCFFCKSCDSCGGSGAIDQVSQTSVFQPPQPAPFGNPCGMGMGMGMAPAPPQPAPFGNPCGMGMGMGMAPAPPQPAPFGNPCGMGMGAGMAPAPWGNPATPWGNPCGMGMAPPVVVVEERGPQRCFKCEGKGFCHDSSMDHDKGPDERCFFCKSCDACGGSGAIKR